MGEHFWIILHIFFHHVGCPASFSVTQSTGNSLITDYCCYIALQLDIAWNIPQLSGIVMITDAKNLNPSSTSLLLFDSFALQHLNFFFNNHNIFSDVILTCYFLLYFIYLSSYFLLFCIVFTLPCCLCNWLNVCCRTELLKVVVLVQH